MSWQEASVVVAAIAGAVAALRVALPFLRRNADDERRAVEVAKRLTALEAHAMDRQGRLPTSIGRRSA